MTGCVNSADIVVESGIELCCMLKLFMLLPGVITVLNVKNFVLPKMHLMLTRQDIIERRGTFSYLIIFIKIICFKLTALL